MPIGNINHLSINNSIDQSIANSSNESQQAPDNRNVAQGSSTGNDGTESSGTESRGAQSSGAQSSVNGGDSSNIRPIGLESEIRRVQPIQIRHNLIDISGRADLRSRRLSLHGGFNDGAISEEPAMAVDNHSPRHVHFEQVGGEPAPRTPPRPLRTDLPLSLVRQEPQVAVEPSIACRYSALCQDLPYSI